MERLRKKSLLVRFLIIFVTFSCQEAAGIESPAGSGGEEAGARGDL